MTENKLRFKLNAIYLAVYGALAFYSPFLIIYFKYRNLSYAQMGILFAVLSLSGILCQPFWGYITDKYLNARKTLIIGMAASSLCIFLVTFSSTFWSILASIVLVSLFQNSICPILDAFCYRISSEYENIHYENVRIRGSFGYAVAVIAGGLLTKYLNISASFYMYCILNTAGILVISSISYKESSSGSKLNIKNVFDLFRSRKFTMFILTVALLNFAMGSNGSYIEELLKQTGGDVSSLGALWFIVAMSEIPVFFFGNRILRKVKDLKLLYIALFFYAVRFFADSICSNWAAVMAVQLSQSVTYALYLISTLHYLDRIVDPGMRMSGMTIYSAIGGGLGSFAGNLSGGILLDRISIFGLYKLLSLVSLFSLLAGFLIEGGPHKKKEAAN